MSVLMEVGAAVGSSPVLKFLPEDFAVKETLLVELVDEKAARFRYLMLRKKGFTTMEAVRLVASHLGLPTTEVTYGGLKDEDGITEQLLAIPFRNDPRDEYGFGIDGLDIGGLQGNAFRIVLRNLDETRVQGLTKTDKINHVYLNYYDTQRFGVPGGPKRTHYVGAAMVAGEWDRGLAELTGLQAPESADAGAWTGSAEEYFKALDWRTSSFYLAAHASAAWNVSLGEVVGTAVGESAFDVSVDGIGYRYVRSSEAAVKIMDHALELPYTRHTYRDGQFATKESRRPSVVQTTIMVGAAREDELFSGRHRVELRFFLPSGSYATAAIRQLLGRVE
jgi:tRNA pseudouridine13 synthase